MKKLTAILLALVFLLTLTGCETAPETEVKYILLEMTLEMSQDYTVKYVYQYDENWNQTHITTYINGELENETTYEIDPENGDILKLVTTSLDGSKVEIEYKNTYDEKGNLTLQQQYSDGVLAIYTEYTYDAEGDLLSMTQKNPSNASTSILTYDGDGHILRTENIMEAVGERAASHAWVENTYDENGNQIKSVNYYNNGEDCKTTVTEYDSQGRKVKSTTTDTYSGAEVLDEVREYTYDGNTETERAYDADGNLTLTGTRTYDDAGNLLVSESRSETTNSVTRTTYTWQKVELPVK